MEKSDILVIKKQPVKEYAPTRGMDKKRKTNAIPIIKDYSVDFYGKNNYKTVTDPNIEWDNSKKEIIKEYKISNKKISRNELYNIIASSGNTITLYDIIEWFNEQYKSIKKDAEKLPKLDFIFEKWETDSLENASFVFDRLVGRHLDNMDLHFIDKNESPTDFFHRLLVFSDNSEKAFIQYINANFKAEPINEINKEIVREYLELSKKYLDYLNAYAFLRQNEPTSICNTYHYEGQFDSCIYGNDPYRKLDKIMVGYNRGGNEDSYFFTYKLGVDKLENPITKFVERKWHDLSGRETMGDLVDNNPHAMAKTLRLNRKYLSFKIK